MGYSIAVVFSFMLSIYMLKCVMVNFNCSLYCNTFDIEICMQDCMSMKVWYITHQNKGLSWTYLWC